MVRQVKGFSSMDQIEVTPSSPEGFKSKCKYEMWGDFLKLNREKAYRSAREFCHKVDIGISYPQYSRYEAGEQLPNLNQALFLCKRLGVPLLKGLCQWSLAQIVDSKIQKELSDQFAQMVIPETKSDGISALKPQTLLLDDFFVFNRSHLELFSADPIYRDLFTYVNSFGPGWISIRELALAHEISFEKTVKMVDELGKLGVMDKKGDECRALKRLLYFPDDEDFFQVRNQSWLHNAQSILKKIDYSDVSSRKAYRTVITRELNLVQVENLISQMDELVLQVKDLAETKNPEKIFSLCFLLGQRFSKTS